MTQQQKDQLIQALVAFVVRAAAENAKPEELALLPAVAGVLTSYDSIISRL